MAFVDKKLNYPTKMSNPKQMNSQVLFREVQKISQIWVWLTIAIPVVLLWYGAYQQAFTRKAFGDYGNRNPSLLFLAFLYFSWGMN